MFALLGEILFEALTSPEGLRAATEYAYAEHRIIEAPPRLQWLAPGLETIVLELGFHVAFTNPKSEMDALRAAGEDHQARALVFGNGVHRGYFVIERIEETHAQLADDGSFVAMTARVRLKEWVPGAAFDATAIPQILASAPAVVTASLLSMPNVRVGNSAAASSPSLADVALYDPNQPIGASNPAPALSIRQLSQPGAETGLTYARTRYAARGVSSILNAPAGNGPPALTILPGDVPASAIVRGAE